nr:MAG TPA: hypothetical protein [Caudoviricetes sp.]
MTLLQFLNIRKEMKSIGIVMVLQFLMKKDCMYFQKLNLKI